MVRKTMNKGLGLTGLSLLAGLMMSGAVLAQDAGDNPEIAPEDGAAILVIDDGWVTVDPICIDCMGEIVDGGDVAVDDGSDGGDDGWVDDGSDGGDDGWVDDGTDVATDDGWVDDGSDGGDDGWVDDGTVTGDLNPEIYYMSGGPAPEMAHRGLVASRASHSAPAMRRGEDLCVTPAAQVVWLCELVNGKSE